MSARPAWIRYPLQYWELLSYKLPATAFHAYVRLYLLSSYTGGRLPCARHELAAIASLPESVVRALIDQHQDLFDIDGESLVVRHAADELARSVHLSEQRTSAGRRGAASRWHKLRIIDGGGSNDA
jgi:hypothetical protein